MSRPEDYSEAASSAGASSDTGAASTIGIDYFLGCYGLSHLAEPGRGILPRKLFRRLTLGRGLFSRRSRLHYGHLVLGADAVLYFDF